MILEEFVSYYRKHKTKKGQAKQLLLAWLKEELGNEPKKNYQKVIHNELEIVSEDSVSAKNRQGEALLNSLIRITTIIEEKECESSFTYDVKSKDYLHA